MHDNFRVWNVAFQFFLNCLFLNIFGDWMELALVLFYIFCHTNDNSMCCSYILTLYIHCSFTYIFV